VSLVVAALLTFTDRHICLDCGAYLPVAVHRAGRTGFYLGRICPDCLYVDEILAIFASRRLAEVVRWFLDASGDLDTPPSNT
jgi:hypothetical protein